MYLKSFPYLPTMDASNDKELADRCQSCGMPLHTGGQMDATFFGTAADGSPVKEFCKFCYAGGAFVEPQLSMKDMIDKSVSHMTRVLHLPGEKAKELATATIPRLKRWQKEELP